MWFFMVRNVTYNSVFHRGSLHTAIEQAMNSYYCFKRQQAWWLMISALWRLRQKDCQKFEVSEFQAILGYRMGPCLTTKQKWKQLNSFKDSAFPQIIKLWMIFDFLEVNRPFTISNNFFFKWLCGNFPFLLHVYRHHPALTLSPPSLHPRSEGWKKSLLGKLIPTGSHNI